MTRILSALSQCRSIKYRRGIVTYPASFSTSLGPPERRRHDPLRILFCGSDAFSIASLKPLVKFMRDDNGIIETIDVLCRTDKPTGRGLKTLAQVPIKSAAEQLGISVYQTDRFKDFDVSSVRQDINLIVAVSFGLLIPAKVIQGANYGGINVHPSLLPDLRGAAPLHHTLLQRRRFTGVSVQTLHPTKFDHGELLAQTPLPGIPILDNMSAAELQLVLAAEGSKLLSKVIQHALFVQPITPIVLNDNNIKAITDGKGLSRAPKILKSDTKVKWDKMTADDILLRHCVFGSMWDENLFNDLDPTKNGTRIIFESLGKAELQETAIENLRDNPPGYAVLVSDDTLERIVIKAADSTFVELLDCTIAGEPRGSGKSLRKLKNLLQSKDHRIRSY